MFDRWESVIQIGDVNLYRSQKTFTVTGLEDTMELMSSIEIQYGWEIPGSWTTKLKNE